MSSVALENTTPKPGEALPVEAYTVYGFSACPYTQDVLAQAKKLGVRIELRDPHSNAEHKSALLDARKSLTTPVLRTSEEEWIPESKDIIRCMQNKMGYVLPWWKRPLIATLAIGSVGLGGLSLVAPDALRRPAAIAAVVLMLLWRYFKR